jgi:hypothetical protein
MSMALVALYVVLAFPFVAFGFWCVQGIIQDAGFGDWLNARDISRAYKNGALAALFGYVCQIALVVAYVGGFVYLVGRAA